MLQQKATPNMDANAVAGFTRYTCRAALAGNPNTGKSTLFNALTGAQQHVGNWPGKTVEKRDGRAQIGEYEVALVDLPGTYSLSAYSVEEIITRDYIVSERPDAVVAVADAANLERNLYLVVQLLELGAPLVLALNMSDVAEGRGIHIDTAALSAALGGVPVVTTVGSRQIGLDALRAAILQVARRGDGGSFGVDYGQAVERELAALQAQIEAEEPLKGGYPARWLAIKLLEDDEDLQAKLAGHPALLAAARESAGRIADATGEEADTLTVDRRYGLIAAVVRGAVARPAASGITRSDRIDRVLTHRWLGLPLFLALMWIVFQMVANVSAPLLDWVDGVIGGPVTQWIGALLGAVGLGGTWVESLLVDGVVAGVGGVLTFVPVLAFLYLAIALLEDSGYMARAALVMDRFMRVLGLHGKSFLPLLVGFGCTVPAIYATRTLENENDRRLTAFLTTFMSCGARLPVYVVFGSAFFGAAAGGLVFAMYLVGVGVAVLTGLLLRWTVFRGKPVSPLVIELPPYRVPTLRGLLWHIKERILHFIGGVWSTVMIASVVIWALMAVPAPATGQVGANAGAFDDVAPADSLFGAASRVIAPLFAPAGFGDWEASGALVTGFVAKEVVISTMSQIYVGGAQDAPDGATTTLLEDLGSITFGFGEALLLTGQEVINIVPRTVSILPGVVMPEANFLGGAEGDDSTALEGALRGAFSPLAAVAFNVFVLLYVPCMVSVAAMRQEFGARWTGMQVAYTLFVAWLAAVIVYQGGLLLGLG